MSCRRYFKGWNPRQRDCAGFIDTPMFHQAVDQDLPRQQKILGHTPQCCYGKPEDIGWAATYLSSEAAGFVNGSTLVVDGGFSIGF